MVFINIYQNYTEWPFNTKGLFMHHAANPRGLYLVGFKVPDDLSVLSGISSRDILAYLTRWPTENSKKAKSSLPPGKG